MQVHSHCCRKWVCYLSPGPSSHVCPVASEKPFSSYHERRYRSLLDPIGSECNQPLSSQTQSEPTQVYHEFHHIYRGKPMHWNYAQKLWIVVVNSLVHSGFSIEKKAGFDPLRFPAWWSWSQFFPFQRLKCWPPCFPFSQERPEKPILWVFLLLQLSCQVGFSPSLEVVCSAWLHPPIPPATIRKGQVLTFHWASLTFYHRTNL